MAAPVKFRSNGRPAVQIDAPGVYDIDEDTYHKDPVPGGSLSSTGARKLLPPSCPALFKHEQDNPSGPKKHFDYGHAAHLKVLGRGAPIVVCDFEDWKTKPAQEKRKAAYAEGKTPLLRHEHDQVEAMAAALKAHPFAAALFDPSRGTPEQSLFWIDEETGVWCRARLDWMPAAQPGRLILADYKTCVSVEPGALQRAVHQYAYFLQAAWYLDGVSALGIAQDAAFVFVAQEKQPPYLVTVFEVDSVALALGHERSHKARRLYAECSRSGRWPGYSLDVQVISLPPWAEKHEGGGAF